MSFISSVNKLLNGKAVALVQSWLNHVPQRIGTIAVSHGLLSIEQVSQVLQKQTKHKRRFGEIAIELELLVPSQVDRLLRVQKFRQQNMAMEALELTGYMRLDRSLELYRDFLNQTLPMEAA